MNKEQEQVKTHNTGPLLVAAVPGSGKTRCIVERIKYLIDSGINRKDILAVTFTNKAANEMRNRIEQEGYPVGLMTISTFHSLCTQILRKCCTVLGFTKNFNIYDDKDQRQQMKRVLKELGYMPTKSEKEELENAGNLVVSLNPDKMVHMAETIKNSLLSQEEIEENYALEQIQAFELYQKRLKLQNAMDFTDLLYNVHLLFENKPRLAKHFSEKWKHILVDEMQDTNVAQYAILQHLMTTHDNVTLVGDGDQSVYGWRGASPSNISDFANKYNPKIIKLETNYRSTPEILDKAYNLISHNPNRIDVKLITNNNPTNGVHYLPVSDNKKEAELIVRLIRKHRLEQGLKYSDFTILYRTNAISHEFESICRHHKIPYKVYGGFGFYDRKEIKTCMAYMKFLANPNDVLAWHTCIANPKRGLGDVAQIKTTKESFRTQKPILEICANAPTKGKNRVNAKQAKALKEFAELFDGVDWNNSYKHVREIIEWSGLLEELEENDKSKNENRMENALELLNSFEYWVSKRKDPDLAEYLQEIQLDSGEEEDVNEDHVKLMTMHAAKGLEFPVTFLTAMEDGILPHKMALEESGPEEERRLAYVAMTRAMKYLYLTRAEKRFSRGDMKDTIPSRFLYEAGFIEPEEGEEYEWE